MKTSILFAVSLVCAGAAASAEERTIAVEAFEELAAAGRFDVQVEVGPAPGLRLEGDPEDIDRLEIRNRGDRLEIRQPREPGRGRRLDVVAYVTTPSLRSASAAEGVRMEVTGVAAERLELDAAMGAILRATGQCEALEASAAMGGVVDADELVCAAAEADAAMGGVMRINATDSFEGDAAMGGSIHVVSMPPQRSANRIFGGDIQFETDRPGL